MKIILPQIWLALSLIFFINLLLFYFLSNSHAESPITGIELSSIDNWQTDWTKCTEKKECKLISFGRGCYALGAVNKKSEQKTIKFLKNIFNEDCSPTFFDRLFTGLTCLNNRCELQ